MKKGNIHLLCVVKQCDERKEYETIRQGERKEEYRLGG
jgi:hypothetical protein